MDLDWYGSIQTWYFYLFPWKMLRTQHFSLQVQPIHRNPIFEGTATDLSGLFKIHASTGVDENLQQIVCSTAKEWWEVWRQNKLVRIKFYHRWTNQSWVNRTEETWYKISMPMTVEGVMQLSDSKKQFLIKLNFFKSLDIVKINSEVEFLFYPSTYEFWENINVKKKLMFYLKDFSRNKKAYDKQSSRSWCYNKWIHARRL